MANILLCCLALLLQNSVQGVPVDALRKSDPMTDTENMADHPGHDSALIPPHLVVMEDHSVQEDALGDPLNPNDFSTALEINAVPLDQEIDDPILMADLFQGDIRIQSNDELFALTAHTASHNITLNNAIIENEKKWPKGLIPYVISASYNTEERATIAKAMAAYHQSTCIQFIPRTRETDYIHITKGSGCSSAVGRTGGQQTVSLGNGCLYFGIVIHELMHAAGFWHEQSRADRDDYITIVWSNIQAGMDYNFQKYDWSMIQSLGVSYDLGSIMHYGAKSFAKDRSRPTIVAQNGQSIGQRDNFSALDVTKLNKLYECQGGTTPEVKPSPPPVPVPDNCLDNHENCQFWASKGECEANPSWMNPNCQKSCNQCGKCQDENKWCPDWKRRGECENSSSYMEIHCKSSCGLCSAGPSVPKPTTLCKNEHVHCDAWAQLGECDLNPVYMKKFCAKACNTC